jgi:hypothetical protein
MINSKKVLNLSSLIIIAAIASSCSSGFRRPESIEDKMSRFEPRNTNPNTVPKISLLPVKIRVKKGSRGPASVADGNASAGMSNKRLYFLGLYSQYKQMGKYITSEKTPEINHCPAFHSTLLDFKERAALQQSPNLQVNFDGRYQELTNDSKALYPELALPVSLNDQEMTLFNALKTVEGPTEQTHQLVSQAIKVHLTKTHKELEELCDSGTSQNYYNYENLTTHVQRAGENFGPTAQSLSSLLKTTLFSNKAIIESLSYGKGLVKGRFPASSQKADDSAYEGVVQNLGANWTKGYFKALKKIRK